MRKLTVAIIVTFFWASLGLGFASDADAAKPRVTWKHTKSQVVKGQNGLELRVFIQFTNNSTDEKVITRLYDKEILAEGTIIHSYTAGDNLGGMSNRSTSTPFRKTIKSAKVNKTDIWPGKGETLYFSFPLKELINVRHTFKDSRFGAGKIFVKKVEFKYRTGSI